jgi:hypothetical protein
MRDIRCIFGFHDMIFVGSEDIPAKLPEGWLGDPGFDWVKIYKCRRRNCTAEEKVVLNYTEIGFCKKCNKLTRIRYRVWSDAFAFGWDKQCQDDCHQFAKCIECGNIEPSIESMREAHWDVPDWPEDE